MSGPATVSPSDREGGGGTVSPSDSEVASVAFAVFVREGGGELSGPATVSPSIVGEEGLPPVEGGISLDSVFVEGGGCPVPKITLECDS